MLNYIIQLFTVFDYMGHLHVAMVINAIFFFKSRIFHYAYGNLKYALRSVFSLPYACVMTFFVWCESYYATLAYRVRRSLRYFFIL